MRVTDLRLIRFPSASTCVVSVTDSAEYGAPAVILASTAIRARSLPRTSCSAATLSSSWPAAISFVRSMTYVCAVDGDAVASAINVTATLDIFLIGYSLHCCSRGASPARDHPVRRAHPLRHCDRFLSKHQSHKPAVKR